MNLEHALCQYWPGVQRRPSATTRSTPAKSCCANSSMESDSGSRPDSPVSTTSTSARRRLHPVSFANAPGILLLLLCSYLQTSAVDASRAPNEAPGGWRPVKRTNPPHPRRGRCNTSAPSLTSHQITKIIIMNKNTRWIQNLIRRFSCSFVVY